MGTMENPLIARTIDAILRAEGGYVNDPQDKGGETNYGITVAVARANGYTGPMRDLPVTMARAIYTARYITEPKFDQVLAIHAGIGAEVIDTGVNMGPHRAAEFLQRWLNGFNDTGARYPIGVVFKSVRHTWTPVQATGGRGVAVGVAVPRTRVNNCTHPDRPAPAAPPATPAPDMPDEAKTAVIAAWEAVNACQYPRLLVPDSPPLEGDGT